MVGKNQVNRAANREKMVGKIDLWEGVQGYTNKAKMVRIAR